MQCIVWVVFFNLNTMIKKELKERSDIEQLVNEFYNKVRKNEQIGPIFESKAEVNWQKHLPKMYDFWESILLDTYNYSGNPMAVHENLHQKFILKKEDFDTWRSLFVQTVDEFFEGNLAERAKQRAMSISTVMQMKILNATSN